MRLMWPQAYIRERLIGSVIHMQDGVFGRVIQVTQKAMSTCAHNPPLILHHHHYIRPPSLSTLLTVLNDLQQL